MDEEILDNGMPNKDLKNNCESLFYFGGAGLKGNVGLKNLGYLAGSSNEEFQEYLDSLSKDNDLIQ